MKLLKKSVSLLLALCMILSYVPGTVFAADAGTDDFYKVVHFDCGRKYFTPEQIKAVIDEMAEVGLNQLQLYLSDNQGFRFALDENEMKISVSGVEYDLNRCLGDGYMQDSSMPANDNHFKPSGENGYLTKAQMTEIIAYARAKNIDIIPCINVPGHMGAILNPTRTDDDIDTTTADAPFSSLRYETVNGTALSSIDLTNQNAVDFALAVTQLYVNYFAGQDCKYYCIGADEYGYDAGLSVSSLPSAGLYDEFISFMNSAADIITGANMIPRAFNDAFYLDSTCNVDTDYEVYFWNGSANQLNSLVANNHKIINTSQSIYWAVGSSWAELATVTSNLKSFNYKAAFPSGQIESPAGACFCIWNDVATARTGANIVSELTLDASVDTSAADVSLLKLYANTLKSAGPVKVNLLVGESYGESFTLSGEYTAEQIAELYGFGSVLTADVTVVSGDPGKEEVKPSAADSLVSGGTYVFSDGGSNYLVFANPPENTTDAIAASALIITEKSEGVYSIKSASSNEYLYVTNWENGEIRVGSESSSIWHYDSTNKSFYNTVSDGNTYVLGFKDGKWKGYVNGTPAVLCTPGSAGEAGTPGSTTFTFKGAAVGTVTFTGPDGVKYTVNVASNVHECDSKVAATCIKGASCSICGEEQSTAKNANNHAGTISEANCAAAGVCDACHQSVGSTNPSKHTGETYKVNEKPASSTEEGYTGDIYCSGCNTELSKGTTIPMVHVHTGGVADCTNKAICSSCGEPYGNVDLNNHVGDRKITGITATYTGDTVCVSCDTVVERGTAIANDPTAIYITVPANGTATHTMDGELVANGTSGEVATGLTYSVAVTEIPATGGSGSYPDFAIYEQVGTVNYKSGDCVVYGGVVYKCINDTPNYWLPSQYPACWQAIGPAASGGSGSGEPTYSTVVTFTAASGMTNGVYETTIGDQKFIITVTGGNDPIIPGVTCEHTWEQKFDANGHWNYCEKCGSSTTKESHSGGTATCKEQAVCSTCNQKYGELAKHSWSTEYNYDADGHWQTCTVEGCGVTSEKVEHAGGNATCKDQAVCSTCKQSYGDLDEDGHIGGEANCQQGAVCTLCSTEYTEKDTDNHVGPMVEVENTYVAPTDDTDGKEADKQCSACETVIPGAVIPALNTNIVEITIATGGTYQITISGKDVTSSIVAGDNNTATAVNSYIPAKPDKEEVPPLPVNTLVSGGSYIFADGNGNHMGYGNPVTNKTNQFEASKFIITETETPGVYTIQFEATGEYLILPLWENGEIKPGSIDRGKWTYDSATMSFKMVAKAGNDDAVYTISFDGTKWKGVVDGTPAKICIPGEPFEAGYPSSSTVTFTGVNEGVTYITVDGTRYKINVVDAALLNAKLATPTWQTNRKAQGFADKNGTAIAFGDEITAASHVGLITEAGVALSDVIPPIATKIDESNTLSPAIFWRGMRHNTNQKQGTNVDFHLNGDIINYIKYNREDNKWYGSADRNNWLDLTGYTLDIYYLQETAVTKEVITRVVDWGPDYVNSLPWEAPTYVLLDFAVHYDGVGRTPALTSYPNAGSGVTGKNDMTVAYHCTHTTDDKTAEITVDGKTTWQRRIDAIFAIETEEYDIYMITVTRTEDDPAKQFAGETSNLVEDYSYNGTEYIIWTDTEATYNQKLGQTTMDGKVLAGLELRKDDFDITSKSDKMLMTRTVGGDPVVDYIQIYENQGLLVTYYVRAKQTEDALHVHYRMEGSDEDIHMYYIAVQDGTYFDGGFAPSAGSTTGLQHNTVTEFYGNNHTVTSNLSDLFDAPAEYRTGIYKFNQHIDFVLENGTKVNQKNYDSTMGPIKEVILYYALDNVHYVPVDFGRPLVINPNFFQHHVTAGEVTGVSLNYSQAIGPVGTYGSFDIAANQYTYQVNTVMTNAEKPFTFTLTVKVPTDDGYEEVKENHNVVFLPATSVYYDEWYFVNVSGWTANVGADEFRPTTAQEAVCANGDSKYIYGYDVADDNRIGASNGTYFTSNAVGNSMKFTFVGDGVDIYANCAEGAGKVMVILRKGGVIKKMITVDTKISSGTTNNATVYEFGNSYNVPIVALSGLEHGEYEVEIRHVKSRIEAVLPVQIDGFRVYNTFEPDDVIMGNVHVGTGVYVNDGEYVDGGVKFFELRDMALVNVYQAELESIYADQISGNVMSQVYASGNPGMTAFVVDRAYNAATDDVRVDILDNGPKNEIYLWPGQSLVIGVNMSDAYHIGLKALYTPVSYSLDGETVKTLNTSTDMFYVAKQDQTQNTGKGTITITNKGTSGVLAVTKLKCLAGFYGQNAGSGMLTIIDETMLTEALAAIGFPYIKNGLIYDEDDELRYYVDDEAIYAGVVQDEEGNFYYINSSKKAVKNCTYSIGEGMTNGLIEPGTYQFDEDGKMIIPGAGNGSETKSGLTVDPDGEIRFYINGVATYAGVVQDDAGNLYYINSSKTAVKDCTYRIASGKTNGLIEAGTYRIDENGKLVVSSDDITSTAKNGLTIDPDGEIRYYKDGVAVFAGLVQDDEGNYYYINSTLKAAKSCTYAIGEAKTNGLLPGGIYRFGADGKMEIPTE